jgi:hypothetical protein
MIKANAIFTGAIAERCGQRFLMPVAMQFNHLYLDSLGTKPRISVTNGKTL